MNGFRQKDKQMQEGTVDKGLSQEKKRGVYAHLSDGDRLAMMMCSH